MEGKRERERERERTQTCCREQRKTSSTKNDILSKIRDEAVCLKNYK
jgi:hypothetical protein